MTRQGGTRSRSLPTTGIGSHYPSSFSHKWAPQPCTRRHVPIYLRYLIQVQQGVPSDEMLQPIQWVLRFHRPKISLCIYDRFTCYTLAIGKRYHLHEAEVQARLIHYGWGTHYKKLVTHLDKLFLVDRSTSATIWYR
jgi:hypothetical protein